MLIGDLAQATGVSRRLLRYYEQQGLLEPFRLANGYRSYAESDVARVRHVRALLTAGLPTAVIARLVDCVHDEGDRVVASSCPGMIDHLRGQRARASEAMAELERSRRALDALLGTALRGGDGPPRSARRSDAVR
jgi:DNA-binding transcriptional MerR regulator